MTVNLDDDLDTLGLVGYALDSVLEIERRVDDKFDDRIDHAVDEARRYLADLRVLLERLILEGPERELAG
jgi:hypothetical protein